MNLLNILSFILLANTILANINLKEQVISLNGYWKFEIGDDLDYAKVEYADHDWEEIYVPSSWEDEGFPDYDGYAWYRIHFSIPGKFRGEELYLNLGPIDDVDETFLNGELISYMGSFPPDYYTQAHYERLYHIPSSAINYGKENVLAIRVYDQSGIGGIVGGENGIYTLENFLNCELEIKGPWKFKTGDEIDWKNELFNDSDWDKVEIPSKWCYLGLKDYDGFAWYRKKVFVGEEYEDENLILVLGKIDDMDETFINGHRIGGTGNLNIKTEQINLDHNSHTQLRAYYIPKNILQFNKENTIAIRVYDGVTYGGIVEGPIGITTREKYQSYKKFEKNNFINFIKKIFD